MSAVFAYPKNESLHLQNMFDNAQTKRQASSILISKVLTM